MTVRLRMLKDGTRSDKRLCDSCRFSIIIKGPQQYQERVYCSRIDDWKGKPLPFPVVECSDYCAKGGMTEYEAKEIGWVLEVKGDKVIGFKRPKQDRD
jgi:hypothetical protein